MKRNHYCNCHKKRFRDDTCRCAICGKFMGIFGDLYRVRYKKARRVKTAPSSGAVTPEETGIFFSGEKSLQEKNNPPKTPCQLDTVW